MARPLRILQVAALPFPTPQGSQVHIGGMIRALADRGHRVTLCCYGGGEGPGPLGVRVVRARSVPGDRTGRSGPHWSRLPQDLLLVRAMRRALAEGADLIHAHNVEAPVVAWLASRGRGIPLIYEAHTLMGEELPTYLPGVRGVARLGRWMDRGVPRLCDGAVALTERAADVLRGRVPQVAHIPPGVDLQELSGGDADRARRRWGLGDRPVVVYTGNADPYQDLPVLMEAMQRVDALLLVVTADPEARVRRVADRAGLRGDRLRVVRSPAFVDTLDALAAADVAAIPRRRCAGFPIKLLNQLGCGVPTVAAEGSARAIPGVIAVQDGSPVAMAEALCGLLADPGRRRALGDRARRAVAEGWTRRVQAERLEGLYREVLRSSDG